MQKLHQLTGMRIAASSTTIGSAAAGGNWELDVILDAPTGTQASKARSKPPLAFRAEAIAAYAGVLETFTVNSTGDTEDANDGVTTLREAITAANSTTAADTITFASSLSGDTITLANGELVITNNLSIDGDLDNNDTADITVSGNNSTRVFNVNDGNFTPDKTVSLEGLTITGGGTTGEFSGGGGIRNFETLSVSNKHHQWQLHHRKRQRWRRHS